MAQLSKNEIYEVEIEGYTSEGLGVCHIDGAAVFVSGALAGETCEIKILKVGKNLSWAKVERVLTASDERVVPACPYFPKCGGCDMMHMTYEEELAAKYGRVAETLRRVGGVTVEPEPIVGAASPSAYRNKVIFAVGGEVGSPKIGFYRERSHDIIDVDACIIQNDEANRLRHALRRWMIRDRIMPYDQKTCRGTVRHLFVRRGEGGVMAVLVCFERPARLASLIDMFTAACPELVSIVLNINKTTGNTVLGGDFKTVWGRDDIEDTLCSLRFSLSPRSFYQVNRDQAEKLYGLAAEFADLRGGETLLDLYCGTGTIGLSMAKRVKKLIGVEVVESAVFDARNNAERNGIENAEFICADAGEAAFKLKADGVCPDVIIVDPPRKGLGEDVVETVCAMAPKRVVYVSCDPATLARDVARFAELGYRADRARPVDMFPRTSHVETVVLLSREKADDYVRISVHTKDLKTSMN